MTYRIGQKVRIVTSPRADRIGRVATVVSGPVDSSKWEFKGDPSRWQAGEFPPGAMFWRLSVASEVDGKPISYPTEFLAPIDDDLADIDSELSSLLPRTIRDLCSAGDLERAKRRVGA